jgi:hypothetical protein
MDGGGQIGRRLSVLDGGGATKDYYYYYYYYYVGARGGVVVKALRYKPAGRGFDSRWCHWNSSLT